MDAEKLKEILDKHAAWLRDEPGGERACLSGADLSEANLRVVFSVGTDAGAVKLTVNGSEYMLTPDGAKDLGNGLLRLAAILRGDKPKRRRHGHGR